MVIYTPRLIYYVYAYLQADGTPYYIGKGKGYRAWDKNHKVSVPKDKTRIIILEANLTEIGSLALERRLIRWYGRKDIGTGILKNGTDGGEGCEASPETRLKMSESAKGRTHSEETKLKISASKKGCIRSPFSTETRLKMSESKKGRIHPQQTKSKMSAAKKGQTHSEETRLKLSEARSKTWNFIDPNGNKLTIKNLTKFCQENYLGITSMTRVSKGEMENHKGWKNDPVF